MSPTSYQAAPPRGRRAEGIGDRLRRQGRRHPSCRRILINGSPGETEDPMFHTRVSKVLTLSLTAALLAAGVLGAQERPGDKGESAEQKKLRGRSDAPKPAEIDSAATLDAMLSKKDKAAFSEAKGATVEGYVVQVEREEDGDYHL